MADDQRDFRAVGTVANRNAEIAWLPRLDREEPQVLKIYEKLTTACKKRNLFAGIHNGTATYAARAVTMGFQFNTIANDSGLMAMAARAAVNGFRKEAGAVADK